MDVERTNSLYHRKELTVNLPQEFCADCHALEARLAASVDHMAEALISINSEWHCTYVNRKAEQLLNRKRQVLIGAIALTAYAGETNQQQALAAGFQRHLPKPVEPETLVQTIEQLLHRIG